MCVRLPCLSLWQKRRKSEAEVEREGEGEEESEEEEEEDDMQPVSLPNRTVSLHQ